MKKGAIIFVTFLALVFSFSLSKAYAGFGFGLPGVVKERVKELDKTIKKKAEEAINHAPNAPSNPSPANGAANQSVDVNLSWTGGDPDAGDAVTYDVYFGTADPPTALVSPNQLTTTCDPGTLSANTTYYWEIVAKDNHDSSTDGPVWSFTTGSSPNNPPNIPSSPSPSNGVINCPTNQKLNWIGGDPDAGDTVTYNVYFGTANPPTTLVLTNQSAITYNPGTLIANTTYYWRIEVKDNHGASTSGSVWSFTTGSSTNRPPNTPGSPSPSNGVTNQSINVDLSWIGGDPDAGDTVTYNVYFGTANPPTTLVLTNQSATTYDPGTLSLNTAYYWKIVATDNHATSTNGPVWSFATGLSTNNPPNAPSNPLPSNGAANQSINVDLSWIGGDPDAGDTVKYDVYFGTANPPTTLVLTNQSATTYDPGTLSNNTTYYWKIVAKDNHGVSVSGPVWSFATEAQVSGQWHQMGPYGGNISFLAIDPINIQIIYTGTRGGGVFKSTNGGSSWTKMNTGLTNTGVISLAIDPINTQIIYAGTTEWGGVFKSTNGGSSWTKINTGTIGIDIYSLAIDPINTQIIYAGTYGGVFKSTNGGSSWTKMNTGLAGGIWVSSLAIDPTNTQIVYAGTSGGVFKSTNGGSSWTEINTGLTDTYIRSLAINPTNTQVVYAGTREEVLKSTNGGSSWANTGLTNTNVSSLAIDPTNTQIIYAGTNKGVFKSTNGGSNWTEINTGLTNTGVESLAINPTNTQIIYTGAYGGVFKSTNGGSSWTEMNTGLTSTTVISLAIDPTNTQIVYAGTNKGVFKSTNGGSNWTAMNTGLTSINVLSLAINPTNTQIIYAGTHGGGVFKSTNEGSSWTVMNTGLTSTDGRFLAIDPTNTQTIYAGTYGGGVFKSTNEGSSWTAVNIGLTSTTVYSLAIDPTNTQIVYAGTNGGVFKWW